MKPNEPFGTESQTQGSVCCVLRMTASWGDGDFPSSTATPGSEQVSFLLVELVTSLFSEPHER